MTLFDERTVERLRNRIGIPVRWKTVPRNSYASEDSLRQFAWSYGDDNPLYCDPNYGANTRWGSVIAPPMYCISSGMRRPVAWTAEQANAMAGGDPLRGAGQYLSSERWAFVRAIRPGLRIWQTRYLHDVELRESKFGGGSMIVLTDRIEYTDDSDRLLALNERTYHYAYREDSREATKRRSSGIEPYTDEELARIDDLYRNESRRGSQPLRISDIAAGHNIPPIVKGPLSVTDIVWHHFGVGWAGLSAGPLGLANRNRGRMPGFYTQNQVGAWDITQRCHWEPEFARESGHPTAYDYGVMRTNWMVHLLTNWMGDCAWISRLSARATRFNYIGDTQWLSGHVVSVSNDPVAPSVDVAIQGVNQRNEVTCTGTAKVLVCAADGTPPEILPVAIEDLPRRLQGDD